MLVKVRIPPLDVENKVVDASKYLEDLLPAAFHSYLRHGVGRDGSLL